MTQGYKSPERLEGYHDCPCPECFEIAIGFHEEDDGLFYPDLCNACEEAGCDGDSSCNVVPEDEEPCDQDCEHAARLNFNLERVDVTQCLSTWMKKPFDAKDGTYYLKKVEDGKVFFNPTLVRKGAPPEPPQILPINEFLKAYDSVGVIWLLEKKR